MSVSRIMQQAAAGNAGEAVYVDDVFSTYLYTGNGSTQTITNGIDLAGEGGLVWTKDRERTQSHALFDTERGANQVLLSNSTAQSQNLANSLTSFNSDGFSLGGVYNASGYDIASWTFRKQPGFFDVVKYTGDGTAGREIAHNLGSTPGMIIVKNLSTAFNWQVYHRGTDAVAPENYYLQLDRTIGRTFDTGRWGGTAPTEQAFTVGNSPATNESGSEHIAYIFAHDVQDFGTGSDESMIKCGSYTGDGTSDLSKEINLGWEPQFLMIKPTSYAGDGWFMFDTMRGIVTGGGEARLYANGSESENAFNNYLVLTPTGFAFDRNALNTSSAEYVYMAIRRPHKPASEFAATELFALAERGDDGPNVKPSFVSNFVVDAAIWAYVISTSYNRLHARLIGTDRLRTNATDAADTDNSVSWDYMDGWYNPNSYQADWQSWMFRRAPGFFDVTTFTGDALDNKQVNHNLGVVPEMFWVKRRDSTSYGGVYHKDSEDLNYAQTYKKVLFLESNAASTTTTPFRTDLVTASSIAISNQYQLNENNGEYIVFLFASAAGISKVGSYTGTGSDIDVDCGFSNGARFVLIKREDGSGDWYVWDSLRGIVAGNDPYFLLNSTAVQVTNTDYIDPLSSGFTVTSSAPAALNASGGNYIFYAIA